MGLQKKKYVYQRIPSLLSGNPTLGRCGNIFPFIKVGPRHTRHRYVTPAKEKYARLSAHTHTTSPLTTGPFGAVHLGFIQNILEPAAKEVLTNSEGRGARVPNYIAGHPRLALPNSV